VIKQIAFESFRSGLDVRKGRHTAGADAMRQLQNAHVNHGMEIEKRACWKHLYTLETGTVGLEWALSVLNTFTATHPFVGHSNPLFTSRPVPHRTSSARSASKCHFASAFFGYLYCVIEYDDGSVYHHYLDDPGAWVAATNYSIGNFRRPTTPNGFRYEVTADAGSAGGVEPTWPTTVGSTVVDSGITWTCRSYAVTDTNCPHSKEVVIAASKIWALDGEDLRCSATGAARDWSTPTEAGFLAVTANQDGAGNPTGLGLFNNQLVVFFEDSAQIWSLDPDTSKCVLQTRATQSGTPYHKSIAPVAQDTFYQSAFGFRSVALNEEAVTTQDSDVGSPIDKLFLARASVAQPPQAKWVSAYGQYVCIDAENAWVFTHSRISRVAAWSQYLYSTGATGLSALTVKQGLLYARYGDTVVYADRDNHQDYNPDTGPDTAEYISPQVIVEFPFVDCKTPGAMKLFQGIDIVGEGTVSVNILWMDDAQNIFETGPITADDVTLPGALLPVEVCATAIAPKITHQANERFSLSRIIVYYQQLGVA